MCDGFWLGAVCFLFVLLPHLLALLGFLLFFHVDLTRSFTAVCAHACAYLCAFAQPVTIMTDNTLSAFNCLGILRGNSFSEFVDQCGTCNVWCYICGFLLLLLFFVVETNCPRVHVFFLLSFVCANV